jgi:hypothetical protein
MHENPLIISYFSTVERAVREENDCNFPPEGFHGAENKGGGSGRSLS